MVGHELPTGYLKAGSEYVAALGGLGLRPEAVLWAHDSIFDGYVLVILTDHFDFAGPTQIYDLLTQAYNASATPKEISPFIIRLHSPKQSIAKTLVEVSSSLTKLQQDGGPYDSGGKRDLFVNFNELSVRWDWVILYKPRKKRSPADRNREWQRFTRQVEKLAA